MMLTKAASEQLAGKFARIGARLKVRPWTGRGGEPRVIGDQLLWPQRTFDLNVLTEKDRETFVLRVAPGAPEFRVLQANAAGRHLLLHAAGDGGGERFLCGHDERHWFVAAVPGRAASITAAKRALLPEALRDTVGTEDLHRRRADAFKRQGEWFFVPVSEAQRESLAGRPIHHGEPLQRGTRNKPHYVTELIRFGGTPVMIYRGVEYSLAEWDAHRLAGKSVNGRVDRRVKDPEVYVRGKVRHPDHATLVLDDWHRVLLNGEIVSANVSFYD